MGLKPDGGGPDRRRGDRRATVTIKVVDEAWAGEEWTLKKAVRTKRFWLLSIAFFFGSWVYQGTLLHSISAMVDFGLERNVAASYFGVLGIVNFVCSFNPIFRTLVYSQTAAFGKQGGVR